MVKGMGRGEGLWEVLGSSPNGAKNLPIKKEKKKEKKSIQPKRGTAHIYRKHKKSSRGNKTKTKA